MPLSYIYRHNGLNFTIKNPPNNPQKLYDAYQGNTYLCSFGSINNNHFRDKLGLYKQLDHRDIFKRNLWLQEYSLVKDNNDPFNPIFWEKIFLY